MTPPLEDCLTRLTGSSTRAGTGCTDLQLIGSSVADCQALTLPIHFIHFIFRIQNRARATRIPIREFNFDPKEMSHTYRITIGSVLRLRRIAHWQDNTSFDCVLSHAGLGHLGKSWIVRGTHNIRSTSIATWARMYLSTVITVFGQKALNHESSKQLQIGVKLCLIIW